MKSSSLLAGVLALLIACGVSFGAGYYVANERAAEPPTPRTHIGDTGDAKPRLDSTPLETPEEQSKPGLTTPDETPGLHVLPKGEAVPAGISDKDKPVSEKPAVDKLAVDAQPAPDGTSDTPKLKDQLKDLKDLKDRIKELEAADPEDFEDIFNGPQVDFAATVAGTVVDKNGIAVAGASVYASYSENYTGGEGSRVSFVMARGADKGTVIATTDASGSFSASISRKIAEKASLQVSLTATADGFAESEKTTFTLKNAEDKQGVKLALRGAGSVSGRVVDASGRGVSGVTVGLNAAGGGFYGETVEFDIGGGGSKYSAVSDASGEFNIEGVAEGRYKFRLSGAGYRQISGPTEIDVKPGESLLAPADFQVAITASVSVKFTSTSGRAVMGWGTLSFKDDSGKVVKRLQGQVNREGVFEKNDPPAGTFDVEINVWGYKPQTVRATILDGQRYDFGTLVLEASEDGAGSIVLPGDDE